MSENAALAERQPEYAARFPATRVVDWAQFAALPAGTLFSYWVPCMATGLYVKGDTIYHDGAPRDFFELGLIAAVEVGDGSLYVADGESRWGMFDYGQQFVVYGAADRARLAELVAP